MQLCDLGSVLKCGTVLPCQTCHLVTPWDVSLALVEMLGLEWDAAPAQHVRD